MPAALRSVPLSDEPQAEPAPGSLEDLVIQRVREYVKSLQGHEPQDLYALLMPQLERPLVRVAMELADGKQRHAASMLGIHRNTLRKRLDSLGLDSDGQPKPPAP